VPARLKDAVGDCGDPPTAPIENIHAHTPGVRHSVADDRAGV